MTGDTIFERNGGKRGIRSAVNGFYVLTLADREIFEAYFAQINLQALLRHQYRVFTVAAGGRWEEDDAPPGELVDYLRRAHPVEMGITNEHFERVINGHLRTALRLEEWHPDDIEEFVGKVLATRWAIVAH
jgi:truncated hemoglobin YjbI